MKRILWIPVLTTLLLSSSLNAEDKVFAIDPAHTSVAFAVEHMTIAKVRGRFNEFTGEVSLKDGKVSQVSGVIQVKSIDTGVKMRDDHLRSPDFFDAEKHPTIEFKSKTISYDGDKASVKADFTIKGITKEVELDASMSPIITDPDGKTRVGLTAKGELNRKDFGINFDAKLKDGGLLVGEFIHLSVQAEAIAK